jgi:FlaA1/EpsC-like NDP-sugar epimerase
LNSLHADQLAAIATGREHSLFAQDLAAREAQLAERLRGARVLVIGGAGSIGSSTATLIARHETAALHVIDVNENALVEVVRQLRGTPGGLRTRDLQLLPLDFGGELMARFLREQPPYDHVLNFAAVKHVRSEKDTCSSLHLVDTNVIKQARLLRMLAAAGRSPSYFSVSTDKAANPVNLMGASKRAMEQVMFSSAVLPAAGRRATSARFANVAFSDGSLLQGWLHRIARRQPIAVPRDTRRFFISLKESGELCMLAALTAPDHHVLIPRTGPALALRDLQMIAGRFLEALGLEPEEFVDERAAVEAAARPGAGRRYPLLVTPLDTAGEKPFEEFVAEGEQAIECGLAALVAIPFTGVRDEGELARVVSELEAAIRDPARAMDKDRIAGLLASTIPEFKHARSDKRLDDRL